MPIKHYSRKKPRLNRLRGSRTVTQNRLCDEFPDGASNIQSVMVELVVILVMDFNSETARRAVKN